MNENLEHITEQLRPLAVSIDTLRPMRGNPRKGDVEAVKKSLVRFGQRKPIVAMADGTISAGHHLHAAAVSLGWQMVAAVFEDDSPIEARAWSLADNRSSDFGRYDNQLLVDSLVEVRDADEELLVAASYSLDDVDDLLRFLEGPTEIPEGESSDPEDQGHVEECPNCGFVLG